MVFSVTLPTPLDVGTTDAWGNTLNTAINKIANELNLRTEPQSYADQELSRPILKDYGESIDTKGNVSGAISIDIENGNHCSMILTGNTTLSVNNPTASGNFCLLLLYIFQDATGGHSVTFPASFVDQSGNNFSLSGSGANTLTTVTAFTIDGGTRWYTQQNGIWS